MDSQPFKPSRFHWFALWLLVISVGINYLDRGNLSVALSSIERDIHLNQDQLGQLGTAFFVSYSLLPDCRRQIDRSMERELGLCDRISVVVGRNRLMG